MKKCPFCAEEIQDEAIVCRFCGRDVATVLQPVPPAPPLAPPKKRSSSNAILMVTLAATVVMVCVALIRSCSPSGSSSTQMPNASPNPTVPPRAPEYADAINDGIEVTDCTRDGDYLTVTGTLKNNTAVTISFVKLKLTLLKDGQVVDTDSTYAVGDEGLRPGEQTQWEWMFSNAPPTGQCSARLLDFDVAR